jgi:hypothetical protein
MDAGKLLFRQRCGDLQYQQATRTWWSVVIQWIRNDVDGAPHTHRHAGSKIFTDRETNSLHVGQINL